MGKRIKVRWIGPDSYGPDLGYLTKGDELEIEATDLNDNYELVDEPAPPKPKTKVKE